MAHSVLLTAEQIQVQVRVIARRICQDFERQDIVLVGLLNGAFPFVNDLARAIEMQVDGVDPRVSHCYVEFMSVSSYGKGRVTGELKIEMDVRHSLQGKNVIIVDDVADSLQTLGNVLGYVKAKLPARLHVAVLLDKPDNHKRTDVKLRYVGFSIPGAGFVYGYGMDLEDACRGLPFIADARPTNI